MKSPTKAPEPLNVIAIMSLGHSGSTLLDLLISSHECAVSVGEVHQLHASYEGQCTCEAPSIWECPFWQSVDVHLAKTDGLSLRELNLNSDRASTFRRDNIALLRAVRAVSGRSFIVDSSKSLERLLRLSTLEEITLHVIQLERTVFGIVYSHMKKGRRLAREARRWSRRGIRMRAALRPLQPLRVNYAELSHNPESVLRCVMARIGLLYQQSQLQWARSAGKASRQRHNIDGNRMRFSTDSAIRPDVKWRESLSARQKAMIGLIVGVDRVLYPAHYVHSLLWRQRMLRSRAMSPPGGCPVDPAGEAPAAEMKF